MLLKNPNPDAVLTNSQADLATEGVNAVRGAINGLMISFVFWAAVAAVVAAIIIL